MKPKPIKRIVGEGQTVSPNTPELSDDFMVSSMVRDLLSSYREHNIRRYWIHGTDHPTGPHVYMYKYVPNHCNDDGGESFSYLSKFYEPVWDGILELGFEYAVDICLATPGLLHSTEINEEQSNWFRAFVLREKSMLAINPIDKTFQYELYFGKDISPDRLIYTDSVPSGSVLCLQWSMTNCVYVDCDNEHEHFNVSMYYSPVGRGCKSPLDSMLVNIANLRPENILDMMLNDHI